MQADKKDIPTIVEVLGRCRRVRGIRDEMRARTVKAERPRDGAAYALLVPHSVVWGFHTIAALGVVAYRPTLPLRMSRSELQLVGHERHPAQHSHVCADIAKATSLAFATAEALRPVVVPSPRQLA